MSLSVWKRRLLNVWVLGTEVPAERRAAVVAQTCMPRGSDRETLAINWVADHPAAARAQDGLERLVAHLQDKTEGEQRDVHPNLLCGLFRYRRGESEHP